MADQPPQPPPPPAFRRRVRIPRLQMAGIALLAALPAAALLGAFGVGDRQASASAGPLQLQVRYADRLRYYMAHPLELRVTNRGSEPLPTVRVSVSAGYLAAFSNVSYEPAPRLLTAEAAEFELRDLAAGQTQRIVVHLEADAYGRHDGRVTAAPGGGGPAEIALSTRVFP